MGNAREEAAHLKELQAVEHVEFQARRQAAWNKAQRLANATLAKATKAVEWAQKASKLQSNASRLPG